jgi:hypothetical protein
MWAKLNAEKRSRIAAKQQTTTEVEG